MEKNNGLIGPLHPPYDDRYPCITEGVMTALHRCARTGDQYVSVAYDPLGSTHYLIPWEHGRERYCEVVAIDYGTIVHLWHAAQLHLRYPSLPASQRRRIDAHRNRPTERPHPVDAPMKDIDITRYFDFTPPAMRSVNPSTKE